jgi:hypothetical protein
MTVSTNYAPFSYLPGATPIANAIPWQFDDPAHIRVTAVIAATGVRQALASGTGFVIGGNGRTGTGTIISTAPWAAGDVFEVSRETAQLQQTDLRAHEALPAEDLERSVDRIALRSQEAFAASTLLEARSVRVPQGETVAALPTIASRIASAFGVVGHVGAGLIALLSAAQVAAAIAPELPANLRGDPGGNVAVIGPFSAIGVMTIPAGTDAIRTSHYGPDRKRGAAWYRRWYVGEVALPAWGQGVWWQEAADGSRWVLNEPLPSSDMFGTVGDAGRAFAAEAVTGTDVTDALNNLTRYLEQQGVSTGQISQGNHRTSDTILLGRGEVFRGVRLIGVGAYAYGGGGTLPASRLMAERNDRPALALQGQRGGAVINIAFSGPLTKHVSDNRLGLAGGIGPAIDDRLQSPWLPGTALHTNGRYNVGTAIAIDPYAGVRPGTSYPDAPYSAAAGESTTQYGRLFSSEVRIEGCYIEGFSCGVVTQPCDADGNGDFVHIRNCAIVYCITPISFGNAQARSIDTSNLIYVFCHTVLAGSLHGRQIGYIGGTHRNWSGGHQICLVHYSAGFSAAVTLDHPYFEGGWRLATIIGTGPAFTINGARFSLYLGAGSEALRGSPLNHIGTAPDSADLSSTAVRISGDCYMRSLLIINSTDVRTDVQMLADTRRGGQPLPQYAANAHNGLAGGIAVPQLGGATRQVLRIGGKFDAFDVSASPNGVAPNGAISFDGETFDAPSRIMPMPHYATKARPTDHNVAVPVPQHGPIPTGAGTSKSLTGRVLKMTYATYYANGLHERFAMQPGDVWHSNTGLWGFVSHYDTATDEITIKFENGFIDTGGTISWPYGSPIDAPTFYARGSRRYLPKRPLTGTFTSGSTGVTNVGVGKGSGAATDAATDIQAGDRFLVDVQGEGDFMPGRGEVVSVNEGAKTIATTAGFPSGATRTLQLMLTRAPVPGVANP